MNNGKNIVAAFDFDGTITYCDTLIPFLLYVGGKVKFAEKLIKLIPQYIRYKRGKLTNERTKEAFLSSFLKGYEYRKLQFLGEKFTSSILTRLVRKKMIQKIIWHQGQGHQCVLVSASLNVYLDAWAQLHGLAVISSRLEIDHQGLVTGKLQGRNCYGREKARRLTRWLGKHKCDYLYAYGDSSGDFEMLQMADSRIYRGKTIG